MKGETTRYLIRCWQAGRFDSGQNKVGFGKVTSTYEVIGTLAIHLRQSVSIKSETATDATMGQAQVHLTRVQDRDLGM